MLTKLIELEDGTIVEVDASEDEAQQISGGVIDKVNSSFSKIKPLLRKAVTPVAEVWSELNQEVEVASAEVTINFSFEGEGNIYVTKAKAGSNLSVKLTLKPKPEA